MTTLHSCDSIFETVAIEVFLCQHDFFCILTCSLLWSFSWSPGKLRRHSPKIMLWEAKRRQRFGDVTRNVSCENSSEVTRERGLPALLLSRCRCYAIGGTLLLITQCYIDSHYSRQVRPYTQQSSTCFRQTGQSGWPSNQLSMQEPVLSHTWPNTGQRCL